MSAIPQKRTLRAAYLGDFKPLVKVKTPHSGRYEIKKEAPKGTSLISNGLRGTRNLA